MKSTRRSFAIPADTATAVVTTVKTFSVTAMHGQASKARRESLGPAHQKLHRSANSNIRALVSGIALIQGLLLAAADAAATPVCVTTSAELVERVNEAYAGVADDEIRVANGEYALPEGLVLQTSVGTNTGTIEISGGWAADCSSQTQGARLTRMIGGFASSRVLLPFIKDLKLSNLSFERFGFGVSLAHMQGTGSLTLRNLAIFDAEFAPARSLQIAGDPPAVEASNILVSSNATLCAASVQSQVTSADFEFVTFVNRGTGSGFCNFAPTGAVTFRNSAVLASQQAAIKELGSQLLMQGSAVSEPDCSCPSALSQASESVISIPFSVSDWPKAFGKGIHRDSPIAIPPLQDAATLPALITTGDADAFGNPRLLGQAPDIGAIEAALISQDGFESSTD